MKMNFKNPTIILGLLAFTTMASAQDSIKTSINTDKLFSKSSSYNTWSFGVTGGVMSPVVIAGGKNDFTNWETSFGFGGYVKKQLWHNFGLQADYMRGTLKADNAELLGNGSQINSPINAYETEIKWAGSLSGVFNFGNFNILNRQSILSPYVSAGAGLMGYRPTITRKNGTTVEYSLGENIHELFVPIALGTKFKLSNRINLDLGYKMNFVDGDNLDGYYRDPQNDKFSYGYAGLEFALGAKSKSQLAFVNPAAVLEKDYVAKYDDMKLLVDAEKAAMADERAKMLEEQKKFLADADKDGVSDYFDKCPNTPADVKVDGAGCPLPKMEKPADVKVYVTEEDKKIVTDAIKNLEFDFGKSTIRSKSYPSLNKVAELLVNKNFSLKLAGHTDDVGSDASNLKLSKDRAESIKSYLVSQGANASRIEATGYGESQPISTNKTNAGKQKNRRVEFTLF